MIGKPDTLKIFESKTIRLDEQAPSGAPEFTPDLVGFVLLDL